MADIFISYSSKDREQAELLTKLLASAGLSVWIDQSGIEVSTSWSKEIVQAINECKAFVVLLSPNSLQSNNVIKEVSLASEKRKKILPLDLEPVQLTEDFEYQLAGIQRAPMTNIDAVIRALGKLGLEATQAPSYSVVAGSPRRGSGESVVGAETAPLRDARKSLMILPFEDLSPTGDNQWFADGIASELISALSNVKALRIADNQATKEFRKYHGQLTTYAREMRIRYFVQGDVRKFGDQIKISVRLLDIETGDHLWQDSMKGVMDDIFEIQEAVALKVVEGLKVHLASDEKKKLAERGTENAEAYELVLKAKEYFHRQSKEGFRLAVQLVTEAIKLDPGYAQAYSLKANALAALCGNYDWAPSLLDEAEILCKEALRLNPDLFAVYSPLSRIYLYRGQLAEAEEAANEYIRRDPQNSNSHFVLGYFYISSGQYAKAIAPFEESYRLRPDYPLYNLVVSCEAAGEREKCAHWARVLLPNFERHLMLHPDDEVRRVHHAKLLLLSGRFEDAHAAALKLTNLKDSYSLYTTASLFAELGDGHKALLTFRNAIEAGFRNVLLIKSFLTDENEGIASLAGTPEYEMAKQMVEKIVAEAKV